MALGGDYKDTFYAGADYGFDPGVASEYAISGFGTPGGTYHSSGSFAVVTDPRTSNQIMDVSKKLSTGAKTLEVQGTFPQQIENMPDQHFEEINRLRKLTGVDLTFHGPLVEPTGLSDRGQWTEESRQQAEEQMWSTFERSQKMDPKGNLNVTFHSSNGLPEPVTIVKKKVVDPKTGKEKEVEHITQYFVIDKTTGQARGIPTTPDYFKSEEGKMLGDLKTQKKEMESFVESQNKDAWVAQLRNIVFHASQGNEYLQRGLRAGTDEGIPVKPNDQAVLGFFKDYMKDGMTQKLTESDPYIRQRVNALTQGDIYLRDAYQDFQKAFNSAYDLAQKNGKKEVIQRLDEYRKKLKPHIKSFDDPTKMREFSDVIMEGVNMLNSVEAPQQFQPLEQFGIEQSAKTFANLAYRAYDTFKQNAPIVSIENPPAGSGLSRAEDLRNLVEAARKELQTRLIQEQHLREKEAKKQAEKLIGVTWDVGHINMIRKYGYDDKDLEKETKKIAPFVNKIHLSDNFGMEHTELPMGMGNVPTKPMVEAIEKYNKQVKKIIETGTWFGPQAFGNAIPFRESLRAFGSPIYSMQMGPSWTGASDTYGGYFSGFGQMLPQQHFQMYGAGFSQLPPELGGQMAGRSRASGAPIE